MRPFDRACANPEETIERETEGFAGMNDKSSAFGAEPEQLDKLLAWPLDEDVEETFTASLDRFAEGPGSQMGSYRLLSVLGEGGMGIVYLAEQHQPMRRKVALKVIKPGMDSKCVIARFEAEQQALALLDHRYVAHVYDAGLAPSGRPYFVMEYIDGTPITEFCDRHRLTVEERLHLFLHVCEAVQHAHQKAIIHRDLKPSNVLVIMQNDKGVPKVIDFGVARAIHHPLTERTFYTEAGHFVGTPEYMSPEQADPGNQDIDTRSDIYSLGVLLYVLLAGISPYDSKTFRSGGIEHIRKVICEEDPKTPSTRLSKTSVEETIESARRRQTDIRTLKRKLRGDLDWITLRALEKDRAQRYATVDAFATDIYNYLIHQPVSAAPPGAIYRARKFMRRHRQATVAVCAGLVILVIAVWAMQVYLQAGKERQHATSLEHERILGQAKDLVAEGRLADANAIMTPLLASTHVGRQAQLLRAKVLLNQHEVEMAISRLEQLVDTPDEVAGQAHMLLASIYFEGDPRTPGMTNQYYERYEYHRRKAEKLIADTADYYFLRAQHTYDIQEMLDLLEKALELDPQHYDSLYQRACIYCAQNDYERLLMEARAMTVVRPNGPQGYHFKATALREMGRNAEAIHEHDQAIHLDSDQAPLYDERSKTYARMHQYETALRDALKCVELEPNNPAYSHKLFVAYTALGQYDQAQKLYAPHWLAGYQLPSVPGADPELWFFALSFKLVFDSLGTDCAWHGKVGPPPWQPFGAMYYADECYARLSSKARRLIPHGFHASWSPDSKKLVYTQGVRLGSALAVLDLDTARTELLMAPGRNPEWSPDGQYIAFIKAQRLLPLKRFHALNTRDMWSVPEAPQQPMEVWVMNWNTREIRRIAEGEHPHWGRHSGRLYYFRNHTLYAVSPSQDGNPMVVLSDCLGDHPVVSPNEQYVADVRYPEFRIVELETRRLVASWTIPPQLALWTTSLRWSLDSRTVSVGNFMASDMGLWIHSLDTRTALKILDGPVAAAPRSPDGKQLAICLSAPYYEIWIADVDSNCPTIEALGAARNMKEHCLEVIEIYNRRLEADPNSLFDHLQRAVAALWIGHDQAALYLQEINHALERATYTAGECHAYARAVISSLSPVDVQLLPLAELLARKAVEKQPDNPDFQKTLDEILSLSPAGDY